jgi:hypothetical protein
MLSYVTYEKFKHETVESRGLVARSNMNERMAMQGFED